MKLSWRDNESGRVTRCPWPVPGEPVLPAEPLVLETPAGKAVIYTETFEDFSLIVAMTFPGGARFLRISPETDWSLEERWDGSPPRKIRAELDEAWKHTVDLFAARNKELRASRAATSTQPESEDR